MWTATREIEGTGCKCLWQATQEGADWYVQPLGKSRELGANGANGNKKSTIKDGNIASDGKSIYTGSNFFWTKWEEPSMDHSGIPIGSIKYY
jgi:predicted carbohydrate-binding protein with CBM5 and CBM33 domain